MAPSPGSDYQVQVFSGGKEVKNFNESLVRRITVRGTDLRTVLSTWPRFLTLPFDGISERDGKGKVMGLRVKMRASPTATVDLGVRNNDLLTAVNGSRVSTTRDLFKLFDALSRKGTASITLERNRSPHKVIYYLDRQGGDEG